MAGGDVTLGDVYDLVDRKTDALHTEVTGLHTDVADLSARMARTEERLDNHIAADAHPRIAERVGRLEKARAVWSGRTKTLAAMATTAVALGSGAVGAVLTHSLARHP